MEYGDGGEPIQPAEDGNGEVYCAHGVGASNRQKETLYGSQMVAQKIGLMYVLICTPNVHLLPPSLYYTSTPYNDASCPF